MTKQFTLNTEFHNTEEFIQQVKSGWVRLEVSVVGYWSSDSITLRMTHSFEKSFRMELSHSSGGRDTAVVKSDLVAEANFGAALVATAEYGQYLESRISEWEAIYQEERAKKQAEWDAEQAAKKAKIEADAALGQELATEYANAIKSATSHMVVVYKRGTDDKTYYGVERAHGSDQRQYFSLNDDGLPRNRLTRNEMIDVLKNSSNRTMLSIRNF